ncbi:MMPL family transporter [Paraliomyxa miuraensis]|uniref:hypothetical protein n=1 Tax=Paraliomyxa miuraensis TaxID=376150 RepID=UPI002251AB37|nr:hypothetical protein [Paraliomyxa miuraensis]MCX4243864.1 hypothetical protein [Paraliomyxa miuraensis]
MSGPPSSPADDSPTSNDAGALSLRRWARTWPRAIVTAWAVLVVLLLARVIGDPGVEVSGDAQGLLPLEHRAPDDELLVLLTVHDDALADERGGVDVLLGAASAAAEQLGERRVPLGPPSAELTAWIDAHALYLLPVQAHEALAERLSDTAMTRAVDALRARLSSPLHGLSGEDPRRDPLRLQELSQEHAGRLTHLGNLADMPAELTAAGDLMALDGRTLLMQVRSDADPGVLLEELRGVLPSSAVSAAVVGPGPRRAADRTIVEEQWGRLLVLSFAGLVVVLSLALRAIRSVVAIVLALGTVLLGMLALGPPLDPHGVPLLVLLLGFGCEGALHLTRISPRGWPAAAVLGGALLPLLLSPYPHWQTWALGWLGGVAAAVVLLRLLVPALLSLWKLSPAPARRGFRLHPLRPLAALLAVAALAGGAWALQRLPFLELDRTPRPTIEGDPERSVREHFFDPRLVVRAWSRGDTPALALEHAAEHARQLATLVPGDATRVDSPGRLVLPLPELQSRKRSLEALELPERMDALRDLLATRGFRPDAFGEFSRGAANLEDLPTPQAALEGPLGAWIRSYLEPVDARASEGGGAALVTRVHVRPDSSAPVPVIETESGTIELRGPAVAARRDREGFDDWLGIYIACQLWLGALAVWLGTRSLPTALGCSVAALTAQTAVLAVMVPTGLSLGAALLPALMLVGAAAMIAGARACRSVSQDERFHATGVLLSGLCQAVAGLALLATTHPLWSQVGLLVAMGAVLASGAGLFVAPGMMHLFGGGVGGGRPSAPKPTGHEDTGHEQEQDRS